MAPSDLYALYLQHEPEIRWYFIRRVRCAQTAAELTQETFIRLLGQGVPASIEAPRAYLYRVASNLLTDHFRKAGGIPTTVSDAELHDVPNNTAGPERNVLARDEIRRLERAIDELPRRRREIFLLHKFEGLSYGEIADRLGIAKNTVMVQMMRALAHCRDRLADND